jgi:2-C-methyl-D-erythritol 4-phosphate cytidylyltransferase
MTALYLSGYQLNKKNITNYYFITIKKIRMKKFALIVAGGSGTRMKGAIPKQFLELQNRPVLMHTFDAFYNYDREIKFTLVLPENQMEYWKKLCEKHQFQINYKLVAGGETRFHSVKNGLDSIKKDGVVFIHDGVRPLVYAQTIQNCYTTAVEKGNALPVIPVSESVRYADDIGNRAVDRSKYFLVQTPQTFQTGIIKKAYQQDYSDSFTDDASVLEKLGETINLVDGNRENIKITYPEDLIIAKSFLFPQ